MTNSSTDNAKPLLSIVTAVYNANSCIEETIKSVVSQRNSDIEYLVIDGGSSDGTCDIIRKYLKEIDYYCSEKDSGVFHAMNKGIDRARGQYIGFMNAGDSYDPNVLEYVTNILKKNADCDVLYGNTVVNSDIDNSWYVKKPPMKIDDKLLKEPLFCHQSSFIKKDAFVKYGKYEETAHAIGDWCHFLMLYQNKCLFRYADIVIAHYQEGGLSTSAKAFRESFSMKKKMGSFVYTDYLRLAYYYLRDMKFFKKFVYPHIFKIKRRFL